MIRTTRALVLLSILGFGLVAAPARSAEIGEVFKRVVSSVVVIEITEKEIDRATNVGLINIGGQGSGVLISEDGKIATAAHVVQTADSILVRFQDGSTSRARVLASEPGADLALIQLEESPPKNSHVAELGDSDQVEIGDRVFVVGAPLGLSHSLTVGHISARRNDDNMLGDLQATEVFQTDAAVNQGNSGGPMFDSRGRVVGIVSYILSQSGGFEGLGFAVTSNVARRLLLDEPTMWSGVQGVLINADLARLLNVPQNQALLVEQVAENSPGSHIGLEGGLIKATVGDVELILGGDIVLEAFGVSMDEDGFARKLRDAMQSLREGDEMRVKVLRAGEVVELENYFFSEILIPGGPGAD